ncbi:MAG: hypothetical protein QUS11_07190 [Candidatus Fermentibacter sp.]|nr:hypothetical protein [Candidatus Fermentibacter sp.]
MRSRTGGTGAGSRIHDVLLVLAGIAGLLAKKWLSPALGEITLSYFGNLAASFSVYYLVRMAFGVKLGRLAIAGVALAVVETFELTNGFGVMSNVYDPFDYLANAFGIAAAILFDMIPSERSTHDVRA